MPSARRVQRGEATSRSALTAASTTGSGAVKSGSPISHVRDTAPGRFQRLGAREHVHHLEGWISPRATAIRGAREGADGAAIIIIRACQEPARRRGNGKSVDDQLENSALEYHRLSTPGRIAILPTKQLTNQRDLALAYSPGVGVRRARRSRSDPARGGDADLARQPGRR